MAYYDLTSLLKTAVSFDVTEIQHLWDNRFEKKFQFQYVLEKLCTMNVNVFHWIQVQPPVPPQKMSSQSAPL